MREDRDAATDESLVARTRRGDAEAFETLVRRHYRAAWSVAWSVTRNRTDAEDVCQDAFVRVLEAIEECRSPERFLAWLRTIVRNTALNRIARRKVREADPLEAETVGRAPGVVEDVQRAELRVELEQALSAIPEREREALLLHDLDGLPHAEVAEALGITEVHSRQLCFVARRRLREILDPRWAKEAME